MSLDASRLRVKRQGRFPSNRPRPSAGWSVSTASFCLGSPCRRVSLRTMLQPLCVAGADRATRRRCVETRPRRLLDSSVSEEKSGARSLNAERRRATLPGAARFRDSLRGEVPSRTDELLTSETQDRLDGSIFRVSDFVPVFLGFTFRREE